MDNQFGKLPQTASRSRRMLKMLEPSNIGLQENIVVSNRRKKPKEETSWPTYINLFDRGKWEELDSFLRKNPFDTNSKKRQPWGKENMTTSQGLGLLGAQQPQTSQDVSLSLSSNRHTSKDMGYCTSGDCPISSIVGTPNKKCTSTNTAYRNTDQDSSTFLDQLPTSNFEMGPSTESLVNMPNNSIVTMVIPESPNLSDKSSSPESISGPQQPRTSQGVSLSLSSSRPTSKDMVYCTSGDCPISSNLLTPNKKLTSNDTACKITNQDNSTILDQLPTSNFELDPSTESLVNMSNNSIVTMVVPVSPNLSDKSSSLEPKSSSPELISGAQQPQTSQIVGQSLSSNRPTSKDMVYCTSGDCPISPNFVTPNRKCTSNDTAYTITDQDNSIFSDQLPTSHFEMDPSIESIVNMPNNSIATMVIPVSPYLSDKSSSPESIFSRKKLNYSNKPFNDTNFSSVIPVHFIDLQPGEIFDEERLENNTETSLPKKKKRKWDRKNYCLYCEKRITNFSKHMKNMHSNQEPVMKYCAIFDSDLNIRKRRRQAIFDELRKQGNYQYNQKVLRESITPPTQSMLLPVKRSNKDDINSAILCKVCLGMYARTSFYKHAGHCGKKNKDEEEMLHVKNSAIKHQGLELKPCSDHASEILKTKIIPLLRKDKKGIAAVTDPLITSLASDFLSNHSSNKDKYNITSKMRDAGCLLLKMKEKDSKIVNFIDCFDVKQLDNMISAVQEISGSNSEAGTVGVIGMPARLSWVIHESCSKIIDNIISDQSFTDNYKDTLKRNIMDFQTVIRRRWKYAISTNAEKTRKKNAMKKDVVMPVDSDIKLLMEELTRLEQEYSKRLRLSITINNYEHLCEVIVGKLIVLNRRRSGEVANAELQFYVDKPKGTISEDIIQQLSDDEKATLNMFEVFLIPGKIVRAVPILFSKITAQNIDLLISCRNKLGIPQNNKFLFARPGTENPFIGANVIRKFRNSLQLKKPEHMTATGLRHHCATMAHVHGKSLDKEDLAEFMGHTIEVHKRKYRYPLEVIQRGKIAPHLMKLGGVNLNDLEKQNEVFHKSTEGEDDPDYVPESSEEVLTPAEEPVAKKKIRKRWTEEEKIVVIENFKEFIKKGKNPGTGLCKELIMTQPLLEGRTWMQVNLLVDNYNKGKTALPLQYRHLRDW